MHLADVNRRCEAKILHFTLLHFHHTTFSNILTFTTKYHHIFTCRRAEKLKNWKYQVYCLKISISLPGVFCLYFTEPRTKQPSLRLSLPTCKQPWRLALGLPLCRGIASPVSKSVPAFAPLKLTCQWTSDRFPPSVFQTPQVERGTSMRAQSGPDSVPSLWAGRESSGGDEHKASGWTVGTAPPLLRYVHTAWLLLVCAFSLRQLYIMHRSLHQVAPVRLLTLITQPGYPSEWRNIQLWLPYYVTMSVQINEQLIKLAA